MGAQGLATLKQKPIGQCSTRLYPQGTFAVKHSTPWRHAAKTLCIVRDWLITLG